jgi:LDH2 family malate/lactate/ureidoglycolate dehydrogenase
MSKGDQRFDAAAIEAFLTSAFVAQGVPHGDARAVASLMVKADLCGYGSHGTFRLRQYVNRLRDGGTNPQANVTVAVEHPATALVDGDNGLGHLAMLRATKLAITKARTSGMAWVGVRNGNHAGPASLYVTMVVEEDMIGIYGAVGSANHVPPFGGMDLLLGTNPIAIAVPAGRSPPFILDMATTVAAAGKIKALAQRGGTMPEGWMVARDGTPLTDPTRHKEGFLLPIGGAKGYGLAMAIGLLAGTLNGAAFGKDVVEFSEDTVSATNTGQFVAAISVAAFADVATFKATVDEVFTQMRASPTLPGHDRVRIPGDQRSAAFDHRAANGVPLHPSLVETLAKIADELNIPKLA